MNSYRRGLRNGVLVNPKLFVLEKFNLAPPTVGWSTWSNLLKTCIIWCGSLQSTPLKEKFRPRNSYLCYGRDEDTDSVFGLPVSKSLPRLGGSYKGPSLRIFSCCEAPSLLYPESALAAPHRISHPLAQLSGVSNTCEGSGIYLRSMEMWNTLWTRENSSGKSNL